MIIHLGYNSDERNAVTKTPEWGFQSTGNLRDTSSVTNPVVNVATSENIALYNYMYIPDFGRSYFITDIVAVRSGLWEVHGRVDVLTSFASPIRNQTAIIARNASRYNLYLDDPHFVIQSNRALQTIEFPNRIAAGAGRNFMLMIAGGTNNA